MTASRGCLDDDDVRAFFGGELDEARVDAIEEHLDRCTACRRRLAGQATERADAGLGLDATASPATALMRALIATHDDGGHDLARDAVVDGQYRVVRALGRGGMGVVYLARDLRLDRDVALKLGTKISAAALQRAEREAVALARLSHPNVVVVYQVGETDGRFFIAMEYVAAGNAREWRDAQPRSAREIVALYCAAGDGLASAHAAGLIHRDFKPDNVLVGADGRPRVADFGLVVAEGAPPSDDGEPPPISPSFATMTQTGAVMGTPAYMAPEQIAGDDVDARADQFAFCVALWEAVLRARPFTGRTPAELAAAIAAGPGPVDPERARGVPRHVIAALRRGLARDRDQRWPSMAALLAELRRDPAARRRRLAIGAAAVAAACAIGAVELRRRGDAPCTDGPAHIARLWNPARAARIATRFDAAIAKPTWPAIERRLDDFARAWAVAHADACRATRVDGSQSEAILDQRALCLDRASAGLDAIVAPLERGDRAAIAEAPETIALLPDLAACADVARLGARAPLPADPARRARIDRVGGYFTNLHLRVARTDDFQPRIDGAIARGAALATGWQPLVEEAALLDAELLDGTDDRKDGERALRDAADLSLASGEDEDAGLAMVSLARDLALDGDAAQAASWIDLARAEAQRAHAPEGLTGRILLADAQRAEIAGDPRQGVADMRELVDKELHAWHDEPVALAIGRSNLALALGKSGQLDEARREITAALADAEAALGAGHPRMALFYEKAATIANLSGRTDDGAAAARRAIALIEAWYGPDDARLINALEPLAQAQEQHDPDGMRATLTRELALQIARGAPPGDIALVESNLAVTEAMVGHNAEALDHGTRALAILEKADGADSPLLDATLDMLGNASRHAGQLDQSEAYLRREVAIHDHAYGATNALSMDARISLAYTLMDEDKAREAVDVLAPVADAIRRGTDLPPRAAAFGHFVIARALWASGDHARALVEAAAARDGLAALGAAYDGQRHQIEGWIRSPS